MEKIKGQPVPTIGAPAIPTGINAETYKKLSGIVDDFIDEIKKVNYTTVVKNLVNFLENQLVIKEIINEDVPRVWDIFGEKLVKEITKISDQEERERQFTQKDFTVIWEIFARRHNNRLRKLIYADFIISENETNK